MTQQEIEARIVAIIERAEYASHLATFATMTRSSRKAADAREGADVSSKWARKMAHELATELAEAR